MLGSTVGSESGGRARLLRWVLALGIGVLGSGPVSARNGDLVGISELLSGIEISDLAQDNTDGSFWVLGANGSSLLATHRVYHLDGDLTEVLSQFENPQPRGSIETGDLSTHRGITYRPISRSLFILSQVGSRADRHFSLLEVSPLGVLVAGSETRVVPDDSDASFYGLAYDIFSREFWTLDGQNDKAVRISTSGLVTHAFTLPGKDLPYTTIRGQGIGFDLDNLQPRLWIPYGDVFSAHPTRLRQFTVEGLLVGDTLVGEPTGVEVPLTSIPGGQMHGVQTYRAGLRGSQPRVAVIGSRGTIYQLEQQVSDPLPPTDLSCSLTLDNQVRLSWSNRGAGVAGAYDGPIQISRNGAPFTTLPGDVGEFLDETPLNGRSSYAVRGSLASGGPFSDWSQECGITVGPGGLVSWTPLAGSSPHDVTEDPLTGELFVTDDLAGTITRLSADLTQLGEVPAPWADPGGICWIEAIQLGFPPQEHTGLLAVAEASGSRVRFIDPESPDSTVVTTISLRFSGVASPRIDGLTYDPVQARFLLTERTSRRIWTFTSSGGAVANCTPPDFLVPSPVDRGITHDPLLDAELVVFEDRLVRELLEDGAGSCPPTGYQVPLESLGETSSSPGAVGGVQISGNSLVVCSRGARSLVRILLFPFTPDFLRGDFDQNGGVNLTDAVAIANYLFLAGPAPRCNDAADVNDDGQLDVSDPVYLLFHLFIPGSAPPPAPWPEPGSDPTFRDNLGCAG